MTTKDGKWKMGNAIRFFVLPFYFCLAVSCSIPSLESPECADARVAMKQFYSFHFGNEMAPSVENLRSREKYLTPRWYRELLGSATTSAMPPNEVDRFTLSEKDFPRTFKIGECRAASPTNVEFQLQLYWRDDEKTEQHEVRASAVKENGAWLLDNVAKSN